jgi:hypothetical protein
VNRGTRGRVLLAAAGWLALAGCNTLLGLDSVTYREDGGATAGISGGGTGGSGAVGGATGSAGTTGTPTFSQACAAYAQAGCGFYERCYPKTLKGAYSTVATCLEVFQAYCAPFYDLPASNSGPADVAACATAYANAPCESASVYICQFPPGEVPAGGTCAAAAQCATGSCNGSGAESCGVCGPSAAVAVASGGSCAPVSGKSFYCVTHHACIGGVCQPVALDGESCGAGTICSPEPEPHLACRGGVCVRAGRAGDVCDADGSCAPGFACERTSNRCLAMPEVQPGQPCISSVDTNCVGGFCDCTDLANRVCRAFPGGGQECLPAGLCGSPDRCAKGLTCKNGFCARAEVGPPTFCGPN